MFFVFSWSQRDQSAHDQGREETCTSTLWDRALPLLAYIHPFARGQAAETLLCPATRRQPEDARIHGGVAREDCQEVVVRTWMGALWDRLLWGHGRVHCVRRRSRFRGSCWGHGRVHCVRGWIKLRGRCWRHGKVLCKTGCCEDMEGCIVRNWEAG